MSQRALEPLGIVVGCREELADRVESDAVHCQDLLSGSRDRRLKVVVEAGDLVGQRPDAPGQDPEGPFLQAVGHRAQNAFQISNWIRNSPITGSKLTYRAR
jgi:hypothetical protein